MSVPIRHTVSQLEDGFDRTASTAARNACSGMMVSLRHYKPAVHP
jgi:hypothetical protein